MGGMFAPSTRIGGSAAAPGIPLQDVATGGLFQLPGIDGVGISVGGNSYFEASSTSIKVGYRPVPAFSIVALAASPYAGYSGSVQQAITSNGRFVLSANSAIGFGVSCSSRNIITGDLVAVAGSPFVPTAGVNGASIALSKDNLFAYVSSSSGDLIQVLSVDQSTGALALVQTVVGLGAVPTSPSPTSIHVTADNGFVMCADANSIRVYRRAVLTGALTEVAGSPFASGALVYGITSTPDGSFVYAANATDATLSAFAWDSVAETLTPLAVPTYACGVFPTGVQMHPSGTAIYVANKNGNSISAFLIGSNGALTAVAGSPFACSANPWQVSLNSDGTELVAGGATMAAYTADAITGVLTPIAGSPFATGGTTTGISFTPDDLHVYAGVNGALTLGGYETTAAPTYNLCNMVYDPLGGLGGAMYLNGDLHILGSLTLGGAVPATFPALAGNALKKLRVNAAEGASEWAADVVYTPVVMVLNAGALTLESYTHNIVYVTGVLTATGDITTTFPAGACKVTFNNSTTGAFALTLNTGAYTIPRGVSEWYWNGAGLVKSSGLITSLVRVQTANGYGSINTRIRRWSSVVKNLGSDIVYADSATLGGSFTIVNDGVYAMTYSDQFVISSIFGISLNTTQPTIDIITITAADRLISAYTLGADLVNSVPVTLPLVAGDVIRAHTMANGSGGSTWGESFTIARVS